MSSIVETPWANILENLVSGAKVDLVIATPFFHSDVLRKILEKCPRNTKIRLLFGKITDRSVADGTTDLKGFEEFFREKSNLECRCIENLHAKVLIVDGLSEKPQAIVTSANFTKDGLQNNVEFGIMVSIWKH